MPATYAPRFVLDAAFPALNRRITTRLHPRAATLEPSASKVGGVIPWPSAAAWPTCPAHDDSLVPVLHLRRNDVPSLPFPEGTDVFQLLWCPRVHDDTGSAPLPQACWWSSVELDSVSSRMPRPAAADAALLPLECAIFPETVVEFPSAFTLPVDLTTGVDQWISAHGADTLAELGIDPFEEDGLYQYHFSVAPGLKVGGHVRWVQEPSTPTCGCGREMEHLLTIASAEFDGAHERWLPSGDRAVLRAPFEVRRAVQCATGITLGDAGSLFVFYCTACGPRSIRSLLQCS